MSIKTMPSLFLAVIAAYCAIKVALIWPHLPQRIATHFDIDGRANGWSSPWMLLGILAVQLGVFLTTFIFVGKIEFLPEKNLRLPNKDYWLAPERRADTFRFITSWTRWLLVIAFGFISWVMLKALEANLSPEPRLELPNWLLIGFGTVIGAMIVGMVARFVVRA